MTGFKSYIANGYCSISSNLHEVVKRHYINKNNCKLSQGQGNDIKTATKNKSSCPAQTVAAWLAPLASLQRPFA